VRAVDGVSLDLLPGETLGVVGESGSGKTTLGRCIMRMHEPTSGSVVYRGQGEETEVTDLDKKGLRDFHADARMIFQDPYSSLNPRMTVEQLIAEPLRNRKLGTPAEIRERVADLLVRVGLKPEHMERYPHAFSGGQRQRIGIARALAPNPKIIIADEATSALDVSLRSQILDLLLEFQQALDLSFIFISHDISTVRYFCDRVAVMYRGELVEIGKAREVCDNPTHAYTKALLSAVPRPDPTCRRIADRHRYVAPDPALVSKGVSA
jgi:peptide/nickel transport system ATP-binding protein